MRRRGKDLFLLAYPSGKFYAMLALPLLAQAQAVDAHPWLYSTNTAVLHLLFKILPHSFLRDSFAEFLVFNPILSTWVFGAAFYFYWRSPRDVPDDDRRRALSTGIIAFVIALAISFLLSVWIHWPAPVRTSELRSLYPSDYLLLGSENSFPSSSTLLYFTVSLSFWRISRRLSSLLIVQTLVAISLPRIYTGGHYPVDVAASIGLSLVCFAVVREVLGRKWDKIKVWPSQSRFASTTAQIALFVWVIELANGFHATESAVSSIMHVSKHLAAR